MPLHTFPKSSHMMATLKSVVWNCGGLTNTDSSSKKAIFFEKTHGTNFDLAIFLETHHKDESALPQEILRYKSTHQIIHSPAKNDEPYSGIICLVSNRFKINSENELLPGRIFNFKIEHISTHSKFNATTLYLPTNNNLNEENIHNFISSLKASHTLEDDNIILGDFNFIDNNHDKANGLNPTDKMACNFWIPFLSELDMVDPFRAQNPNKRLWSFIGTGKAKNSRIDRIYTNADQMTSITNMTYLQTPFGGHRMLQFTKKGEVEHGPGYYKMNTSILNEPKHRELIENLVEEVKNLSNTDPIHRWQTFTMLAKSRSITYSKIRNHTKNRIKKRLQKQMEIIEENPSNIEDESTLNHYNHIKRRLKKIQLEEIEGYKKRLRLSAPYEQAEPDIAFFAKLQKKKISDDTIGQLAEHKEGQIYTDKEKLIEISTKFYKSLYTPNKVNTATQDKLLKNIKKKISQREKEILDAPLEDKELMTAAFQLKKDRSPGLDGLPTEFYQEYWDLIKDLYLPFIQEVRIKSIPKRKNASIIKLVYKNKGEIFL